MIVTRIVVLLLVVSTSLFGQASGFRPVSASRAMVVTAEQQAADIGLAVLQKGGNAVDAAVAVGFALAVTYPYAGNIGGGGFMVLRDADGEIYTLDFREKAPLKAHRDMYLDEEGNVISEASLLGYKAAGVPGSVAGYWEAHRRFGSLSWKELLQPAIELAANGDVLNDFRAAMMRGRADELALFPASAAVFLKGDSTYSAGDTLFQKDLAESLKRIADKGRDGFYYGETARLIEEDMLRNGGLITMKDLAEYEAVWRDPIHFQYRGYDIYSMPPPSSGGVALAGILNTLEGYDLSALGQNSADLIHLWAESCRQIYADRAEFLGDPDFVEMPVAALTEDAYGAYVREQIDPFRAHSSSDISANQAWVEKVGETTHFSIVDGQGNAVSLTTTLNSGFGSKVVVSGTGILLNNEMDDFSAKPGVPNQYGLIGTEANSIAPEKRMLSAMTPTIIEHDDELYMVLGAPGGSRIITAVAQVISNVIDHGFNVREAVEAPRFHHQWRPDTVYFERRRFLPETHNALRAKGHETSERGDIGCVQAIVINKNGKIEGWSDPRRNGKASGF